MTALRAVARQCPESIHVDVVVGSLNRHVDAIKNLCAAHENWTVHERTTRVASLMSAADLGIGGGGVMTWERCGLGLPALIIALADNQAPIAEAVHAAGAAAYLGSQESVQEQDIALALSRLMTDPGRMNAMSRAAAELVDCEGSLRVASAMLGARNE
jgi:UDP-2,4-diacetamido-2,4,6-trideoxy-beta-L-altropyranose hydrolase